METKWYKKQINNVSHYILHLSFLKKLALSVDYNILLLFPCIIVLFGRCTLKTSNIINYLLHSPPHFINCSSYDHGQQWLILL